MLGTMRGALGVVVLFAVWEAAIRMLGVPDYLLPAPSEIAATIVANPSALVQQLVPTLEEAVCGVLVGNLVGLTVAVLMVQASSVERSVAPVLVALRSIPAIAITPLLLTVLGRGLPTLVAIVSLICFFPIVVNASRGLAAADGEVLEMLMLLAASRWQRLRLVQLPYAMPYVFAALRVSTTAAVLGAVVAEWLVADRGLGFFIENSRQQWRIADMWAGITITTMVAVLAFACTGLIERKLAWWHNSALLPEEK